MARWKPTPAQCALIKCAAVLESTPRASLGQIKLCPGLRYNTHDTTLPSHINIAKLSKQPLWEDTDLADRLSWDAFRNGVELCEDGTAIVDFYIHARTEAMAAKLDYLLGNVVVFYRDSALSAIRGIGRQGHDYLPGLLAASDC